MISELLVPDDLTGRLYWTDKVRRKDLVGTEAGCARSDGRVVVRVGGTLRYRSHLVWEIYTGVPPEHEIDHIDGNPSNDCIFNLRDVPGKVNSLNQNSRSWDCNTYSNFDGSWSSYVMEGRMKRVLGRFRTKEEAVLARREAQLGMGGHVNHAQNFN